MKYSAKIAVAEVATVNLIRIACVALCLYFFLPMFNTEVIGILGQSNKYSLTGFDSLFGVKGSGIYGSPFALIAFIFPLVVLAVSLLDFLGKHVYTAVYISGAVGIILSIVYFLSVLFSLNDKQSLFDVTMYEMRTGLSWGCLAVIVTYVLIVVLAFLCKRFNDD
jgi:hypothetical protein